MDKHTASHSWKFFRTGGLDQVALESAADLAHLDQLDPKLWVALSCPVKGLELAEKTLALIDTDNDGRIRVPELLAAVKWASARLKDPAALLKGEAALPLAAINDATPDGQALVASAQRVLANLGKPGAATIAPADTSDTAKIFASSAVNGDGVIPPDATDDAALQALIKDILATVGGTADRAGAPGVTAEKVDAFFQELAAYVDWVGKSSARDIAVLGEQTDAAVAALRAVRAKVEDYFARCRLAAFDARAVGALNRAEADYLALAAKDLKIDAAEVAGFPLARIAPGQPLPLLEGVNPAWAAALATLHRAAVAPVHGAAKVALTEDEWRALNAQFAAYETWLGTKGGSAVEKLGLARAKEILAGNGRAQLAALVAKDKALEPQFKALSDVDRLAHYYRDLRALLHNFVNFADFYSRDKWAIFQAGTLYLDNRSTELCVRVDGPSPLAAMSKVYLAYCTCTRPGGKAMTIAACFTQGDSDYLFVGRHGVFYDRAGNDWDAVVTGIVDNPISIGQAFWAPYKKFLRLIEEQIAKRASAADAESSGKLAAAAEKTANADKAKPAEPKKFDLALITGIGVALGSIATFLGVILTKFMDLPAWKMPLVLVAIMLVISLPSMAIAWLKLRQRTLGPLLEGNGWAVNGRVKINIPFGSALTEMARKPAGSRLSLEDPYEDKEAARRQRLTIFWLVVIALAAAAGWIRWDATHHADAHGQPRYFWMERAAPAAPAPAAAAEPAKS
ncbi:hypothetical protein [Oleiharenicola sp. Vm1]|uniref:hypothetical protein n=1 Tax=Oleiharenicola sp. Vm1 TaxID=3398393 RepID=UPI0039F515C0